MVQDQTKIGVEQTQRNEGSYSYLYPFGDLTQRTFMCASK
jgi:hypothetical protein